MKSALSGRKVHRMGGRHVSQTRTGRARNNVASVSVNRAFKRLEMRGLVERRWYGAITRTERGIMVAKELSAKSGRKCGEY